MKPGVTPEVAQLLMQAPILRDLLKPGNRAELIADLSNACRRLSQYAMGDTNAYHEAVSIRSESSRPANPDQDVFILACFAFAIIPPVAPTPIDGISPETPFLGECYCAEGDHTAVPCVNRYGMLGPDGERTKPGLAFRTRLDAQKQANINTFAGVLDEIVASLRNLSDKLRDAANGITG